jgi:hypothetical protein
MSGPWLAVAGARAKPLREGAMTRSWTDPRTGKRWHIDVVLGATGRGVATGRGSSVESGSALVFDSGEGSFSTPTEDATRLEALEDDKLAELLDAAKSGATPHADLPDAEGEGVAEGGKRVRGPGQASPSAAGRESQPHQDPAKRVKP